MRRASPDVIPTGPSHSVEMGCTHLPRRSSIPSVRLSVHYQLQFSVQDFPDSMRFGAANSGGRAHRGHSYRKLSTGSILAARAAGTVPNRTPTVPETATATKADSPETGIR